METMDQNMGGGCEGVYMKSPLLPVHAHAFTYYGVNYFLNIFIAVLL